MLFFENQLKRKKFDLWYRKSLVLSSSYKKISQVEYEYNWSVEHEVVRGRRETAVRGGEGARFRDTRVVQGPARKKTRHIGPRTGQAADKLRRGQESGRKILEATHPAPARLPPPPPRRRPPPPRRARGGVDPPTRSSPTPSTLEAAVRKSPGPFGGGGGARLCREAPRCVCVRPSPLR